MIVKNFFIQLFNLANQINRKPKRINQELINNLDLDMKKLLYEIIIRYDNHLSRNSKSLMIPFRCLPFQSKMIEKSVIFDVDQMPEKLKVIIELFLKFNDEDKN